MILDERLFEYSQLVPLLEWFKENNQITVPKLKQIAKSKLSVEDYNIYLSCIDQAMKLIASKEKLAMVYLANKSNVDPQLMRVGVSFESLPVNIGKSKKDIVKSFVWKLSKNFGLIVVNGCEIDGKTVYLFKNMNFLNELDRIISADYELEDSSDELADTSGEDRGDRSGLEPRTIYIKNTDKGWFYFQVKELPGKGGPSDAYKTPDEAVKAAQKLLTANKFNIKDFEVDRTNLTMDANGTAEETDSSTSTTTGLKIDGKTYPISKLLFVIGAKIYNYNAYKKLGDKDKKLASIIYMGDGSTEGKLIKGKIISESLVECLKKRYGEEFTLVEDMSTKLPRWITSNSNIVKQLARYAPIDTLEFHPMSVPLSHKDPIFSDETKIPVYRLCSEHDGTMVYIPGVNGGWDFKLTEKNRALNNYSIKMLLEHCISFGYFEKKDFNVVALRNDRVATRKDVVSRGQGQYYHWDTEYAKRPDGSTNYSRKIRTGTGDWYQAKGEDKSGYKIDPEKYKKLLDAVGLNNYAVRLEAYAKRVEKVRTGYIALLSSMPINRSTKVSRGIYRLSDYVNEAIDCYIKLTLSIERILRNEKEDEQKDYMIRNCFSGRWSEVSDLRGKLEEAERLLKSLQAEPTEHDIQDDEYYNK